MKLSVEQFLSDVKTHVVHVLVDSPSHRHLRAHPARGSDKWFGIVTVAERLFFYGDMGDYAFARLPDMFEFFRPRNGAGPMEIDCSYWASKCTAADTSRKLNAGIYDYDADACVACVEKNLKEAEERGLFKNPREFDYEDQRRACVDAARDDYGMAVAAAEALQAECGYEGLSEALRERSFKCLSYGIQWACYAIRWTINKYDASKAATNGGTNGPRG